jgi:predicted nucleic acid-binding protein
MLLLDTDILIDIERKYPPAIAWFSSQTVLPLVPGFVVMELIQGCQNSAEVQAVKKLVAPLQVIWPTVSDLSRALNSFPKHHLADGLGLLDALITESAVGLSIELCTFNEKHYKNIVGLKILKPYNKQVP